jgi:hypothetical protein
MIYKYLGSRLTRPELIGAYCKWLKDERGKCIRGRNGNALVQFIESGEICVVLSRRLRKVL